MLASGLLLAASAFHAPALHVKSGAVRAAHPLLQQADFDYEAIVSSKLPFLSRVEATKYLKMHSTRFVLAKAGVSEATVEEAISIIEAGGDTSSTTTTTDGVDWSMVAFGLADPPPGFTPPKASNTVESWYDSGVRIKLESWYDSGIRLRPPAPSSSVPDGWGIVPMATIEAEYAAITRSLTAKTAALKQLQDQLEAEQRTLARVAAARADVYRLSVEAARQKDAKAAAAGAGAADAKATAGKRAAAAAVGGGDANNAALGGVAAALAAAAAYYFKLSGGGDPTAVVDAASKVMGA